jgi:hypothetical protein
MITNIKIVSTRNNEHTSHFQTLVRRHASEKKVTNAQSILAVIWAFNQEHKIEHDISYHGM